ncbi:MAG: DUF2263 domain-containing protein [Proteobacteria bacterium]|nr:DUF2263 domain-containing protein [Pseudomonadota bacterium]
MQMRPYSSDQQALAAGFSGVDCQRRREVLRETLAALTPYAYPTRQHALAQANLAAWRASASTPATAASVQIVTEDWGEAALRMARTCGVRPAVLNMANAYHPGGAYREGARAQEENMFRRSDCHFHVNADELAADGRTYSAAMTRLLSGCDGCVYLDMAQPRVCLRGPEIPEAVDLGYHWLPTSDVFLFHELRAAGPDLRDGRRFDPGDARRRIAAILDTLGAAGVRHVVLGAIGCGAFRNPPREVAAIFKQEIEQRRSCFDAIVFAIRHAGYGPDNFAIFYDVFAAAT